MRKTAAPKPHKRAGIWYLIRRVPREFAHLDQRNPVRISTDIAIVNDPRGIHATKVVAQLNTELEAYWRGLRDGQSAEARIRFEAAQKRARALGLPYQTAEELAEGSIEQILRRMQMLLAADKVEDETTVAAVFGGERRPKLMLSGLMKEYEQLQSASLAKMSKDQVRKWKNPKKRAIDNLISVISDKALDEITRADAVAFRMWWQARLLAEKLDIGTANKDIGHIAKMLRIVDMAHTLNLGAVFSRLRIEGEEKSQRSAFTAAHVQDKILAAGALDELNDEAHHIIWLIADTGLRLSEAANLTSETIHLNAAVPYISVKALGRKLKTDHSARDIPLVGAALAAMKLHPAGFPRYRNKADSLSALVNKVLGNRKLLPSDNHSLYSLRHTFEDRLTAIEAPEKVIASLMGHKWIRPKYGAGPSLKQKHDWLSRIAFRPPAPATPQST